MITTTTMKTTTLLGSYIGLGWPSNFENSTESQGIRTTGMLPNSRHLASPLSSNSPMSTALGDILILEVLVAVLAHLWFKTNQPESLIRLLVFLFTIVLGFTFVLVHFLCFGVVRAFCSSSSIFLGSLLSSIAIYRLSWIHPLARYPGPLLFKLTKLSGAWLSWNGKPHLYYKALHDKYGPIVRIGPNELSIIDTDLIPNVLGVSGMPKGPMWEGRRLLPAKNFNVNDSLSAVRDLRRHAELRKPWNTAFKQSSIVEYQGMLITRAEQLLEKLKEISKSQAPINISLWINYFTFDFMGDLAFGGVYSLLRDSDPDHILLKMKRGVFLPSLSQHIPWSTSLLRAIPFFGADARAFGLFGVEQGRKRAAMEGSILRKDLFHYLLASESPEYKSAKIVSNALLAIVAGSDTTASALANIIYYILRESDYYTRLRCELDTAYPPSEPNEIVDINSLAGLPFLNAVVNETLRLQPPILSGLQRSPATGSGGKALSPTMFIPEGTAIQVPPYVLHRSSKHFSPDPDRFWPDRWISQDPNIVLDRSAFIPFSTGPAGCAGKPLALIELRYLTCLLVRTFDMSFEEGYDHTLWEDSLVDRFIMLKGELPVRLKVRK